MNLQKFEEIRQLKAAYEEKLQQEGKAALNCLFKEFFQEHPEFQAIKLTLFTPFFSDGDPCHYSLYGTQAQLREPAKYIELDDGGGIWTTDGNYSFEKDDPRKNTLQELEKILDENLDALEATFGDHVRVTITPEGIKEPEEYTDHH